MGIIEVLSFVQTAILLIFGPLAYSINSRLVKVETKLEMLIREKDKRYEKNSSN